MVPFGIQQKNSPFSNKFFARGSPLPSTSSDAIIDHATAFFDWVKSVNTPAQIVFSCVVLSFLLAVLIKNQIVTYIFGSIAIIVCISYIYFSIIPALPKQIHVRVALLDANDDTKSVEATVYLQTRNDGRIQQTQSKIAHFALDESNIPYDPGDFNAIAKANEYETSKKTLLNKQPDGSYAASIRLSPRPDSAKPADPIDIKDTIPQKDIPPFDVRGWKIDLFSCSEHPDLSIPLARKLQASLVAQGYKNVTTSNWPPAGTATTRGGSTFYYALTSPLTINYTPSKIRQLEALEKDLSKLTWLDSINRNEVGTKFSRYFSVVICPGFTEADRYD